MIDLTPNITYLNDRGTRDDVTTGGATSFGPLIRRDLDRRIPTTSGVGRQLVRVLQSPRSH